MGTWGSLPLHPLSCMVASLETLPRHQLLRTLAACRLLNTHWRAAVDAAVRRCPPFGARPEVRLQEVAAWFIRRLTHH
jgi:hypothetical protein